MKQVDWQWWLYATCFSIAAITIAITTAATVVWLVKHGVW